MTAPAPTPASTPSTPDPDGTPGPRPSRGYLATTVGGLLGLLVLGGVGVAVGLGLMELYWDPDGGLANLALLLYPLGLGSIGMLAGLFVGVRTALRRQGDTRATQTAWLAAGLGLAVVVLGVATSGIGVPLLLAAPVAARWLVLQGGA